ncbi:KRAB-A domain-containing protein 2-like [Melitaea cinxia]|uniref:KRAB-A domain-containing protein 2-like n=1 Tax=Melitaea cinxia TaxID=113334 RepID=UPI001E2737E3|nr:KRAB-A domain-containing protein 2-like [Melitaea cinxia]
MLASWMEENKPTKWSNGLKFVQFMKNRPFQSAIKQSPYQAMFGTEPKVGLRTSNLPLEIISGLHNEQDLKVAMPEMNQNFDDNEENQDKQEKIETKKKNRNESMILEAREKSHLNLVKQAKIIKLASDQSHPPLKVGDNVTIPIPDVDKGKADLRKLIEVD